ncbi:MAG: methionine--tRNA ligase [Acidobacteria bacterium]|nr:methionine--tRNA ligase [Acidobacteriota bacterium]
MPQRFYVTTPIYYVNDKPHIGHTYTTVLADVLARFHRMLGEEVYFLTGTDEHGQKIEKTAAARGITPQQLADEVVPNFEALWKRMGLTHDDFIRTTQERHKTVIRERFQQLLGTGDIFKATYKGLYSVSDEAYVTETQAKELQAQGLGHQLVELEEESYFFRLSAYENWLIQLYDRHPEFVRPEFRLNEVRQFVAPEGQRGNLQDLSISRTSITWGIPVPGDPKHVVYVWFDALLNYLSALGEEHKEFWPPTVQIVGKDILRFHAVYWPAFLMAMFRREDEPLDGPFPERLRPLLPGTILAHGWWLMGESKMSKSLGNIVRPEQLLRFGNDAARFFLLRDMQIGHDRSFSFEGFMERLNADLANGLGNLAARSISMIKKYRGGNVPTPPVPMDRPSIGINPVAGHPSRARGSALVAILQDFRANQFDGGLDLLWEILRDMDRQIVKTQPWKLAKEEAQNPEAAAELDRLLEQLWQTLRVAAALLAPIMPELSQQLWSGLGLPGQASDQRLDELDWDFPPPGPVGDPGPLFARIDKEAEMAEMEADAAPGAPAPPDLDVPPLREPVDYDTFARTDLRVGKVLEAERVPKSDKLIKMKVDLGFELRTVVGGIGKAYAPEDLLGRLVVVVANLAPRKLMGIESHGMLLAASDNAGLPYLVAPPADARPGFIVK